jgi:hypothetical protein
MDLLGEVRPMESCFVQFGDGVGVSARWVHGLRQHTIRLEIVYS